MKLTRSFITLALALVGAVGTEAVVSAAEKGTSDTPNVVLLISDDQAWNDYGFMGHEEIETPHLLRSRSACSRSARPKPPGGARRR